MKIEKWYYKNAAAFDAAIADGKKPVYYTDGETMYWTVDGVIAYRLPGNNALATGAAPFKPARVIKEAFIKAENGTMAKRITTGKRSSDGRKITCIENVDGQRVYVQSKYLRQFPKNAVFYISEACKPVAVAIENYSTCNNCFPVVAVIMPVLMERFHAFVPDAE